jgi:hypothetical protein
MDFIGGVLTGLVVAVVVQFVVGLYVQPVIQLREAIWAVDHSIILYGNCYGQLAPEPLKKEAQHKFRDHSAELSTKSRALIGYKFWSACGLIPGLAYILRASEQLILLGNLTHDPRTDAGRDASAAEHEIRRLLRIYST